MRLPTRINAEVDDFTPRNQVCWSAVGKRGIEIKPSASPLSVLVDIPLVGVLDIDAEELIAAVRKAADLDLYGPLARDARA